MWSRAAGLLVLCVQVSLCCLYNPRDKRAHCRSLEELAGVEDRSGWDKLNLLPDGVSAFINIPAGSFDNLPNVYDLQVKNIAKGFENGTFIEMKKLYELHLDDNKLGIIPARTFENPNLQVLYIYNCEVTDMEPEAFEDIPKLTNIWMTGNKISIVRKGVFTNPELKVVYLRKNDIQLVEDEAFTNLKKLEFLSLEENKLKIFEPQRIVGPNPTLQYLYFNRNQVSIIKRKMFAKLPNLRVLLININEIESLGRRAFADLKELVILDISHNQIEEVRPDVFPPKSKIIKLFVHDNRITYLSPDALRRLTQLKMISATGNPWQCACLDEFRSWLFDANVSRICDREVKDGQRPSCVVNPRSFKNCVYDLEETRSFVQLYEDEIKKYPQLPPVCETDGHDTPTLGA